MRNLDLQALFRTVQRMMVINNTYIRCAALRLLKYLCINQEITQEMFSYKLNIFIIMAMERSDKLHYERETALSLVTHLIHVVVCDIFHAKKFTDLIPRSIILSILCIANDATDPLRIACLKLVLQLIIRVPERVVFCDGVQVLLNGCVETSNCSLLQSSILACLYYLNNSCFRQKKTILDLQIILDPLLVESKSVPFNKQDELRVSRYISNIALLTILRTWTGFFIFSGDLNGLNSYINILSTHGEEEPELAKEMLSVLFTVIGVPTPNYVEEEGKTNLNNIYWTNCSLFISSISSSQTTPSLVPRTNLLTTYLSFIVWSLVNSKLPEILSTLMVQGNAEVSFLAKHLLRNLIHLSSVFVCMSDVTTGKTAQQSTLSLQNSSHDTEEELRRKARARDCFVNIGSSSTYLYPIQESEPFVPSSLTDIFSDFSLFYCVLDCICDNTNQTNCFEAIRFICDQGIPFQRFVSTSYEMVSQNTDYYNGLLRQVDVMIGRMIDE